MSSKNGYRDVIRNEAALAIFLRALQSFDSDFCRLMKERADFTLKLEVRAAQGRLIHCRVNSDGFERPESVNST